jgi:hypothetical protein
MLFFNHKGHEVFHKEHKENIIKIIVQKEIHL